MYRLKQGPRIDISTKIHFSTEHENLYPRNLNDYRVCLFFSPVLVSRQNIYLLLIDFETVVNNIIYTLDNVKHCIIFKLTSVIEQVSHYMITIFIKK